MNERPPNMKASEKSKKHSVDLGFSVTRTKFSMLSMINKPIIKHFYRVL